MSSKSFEQLLIEDDPGAYYEHVFRVGALSRMTEAHKWLSNPPMGYEGQQKKTFLAYWQREYDRAKTTYEEMRSGRLTITRKSA